MSPHPAAAPADPARGTASSPSPGLDAAWTHPVLSRLLYAQSHLQRLNRRRPWLLDALIMVIVACIGLPDLISGGATAPFGSTSSRAQLPAAVPYVFTVALIAPLWWRRKAPAAVFFVIWLVSLVQGMLGLWLPAGVSALIALYTLALHGSLRVLGCAVALAAAEVILAVCVLVPVERWILGLFFLLGTVTAATALGLTLRTRRMYLAALEDRAQRLEVERDQRVRLTAAAERARVAREMHDIVGHNLSVMVGVADGAATLAANRGEQSAEALRILGDTGRQAMSELRRVLGVLREDQSYDKRPLSPQPGVHDLDPLLARVRAAGLTVTYRTVGDLDSLGSGVQLTVYRTVQEALTNTLKHAGTGATAEVTMTVDAGTVRIRVADTGVPPGAPAPSTSKPHADPGHGLVGIRQRAAMYGGAVTIGPRGGGHGWVVDVTLDVPSTPAPPAAGETLP
ncbi:sensor histidine kinase [Streptomyces justiciae]|uniref:sensor histidine kinase n=1 Tax=Streptomyces justiciae TaxID=2780140 RepID=UPI002117F56D|nr:histidine kinase [Streptomyces justiciae]MCW8379751.1 histidine kinase [Streptomyces justiciae]